MIQTITDPKELILWHHFRTRCIMYEFVQKEAWFKDHPIPVFLNPEWSDLRYLGKYVLNDGHNRTVAALESGLTKVPILILETTQDITTTLSKEYSSGNLGTEIESRPYEEVFSNVLREAERVYQNPENVLRLERLRAQMYG